ncbi:MAG: aminotransferase class I/II-fold pyridoxal phosphate-dependent enzyme, partial [Clostridia bacterium]|nr:aminotransferase class I/II-fold pyridoxal phosphate-dependent enzyme [Clostridia bacterium]
MNYRTATHEELNKEYEAVYKEWKDVCALGLSLDMSRGKPEKRQLDLCGEMMTILKSPEDCKNEDGFDVRNYGLPTGIPELKRIFAEVMGVGEKEIFTGGNSSLNLMYNIIVDAMAIGFKESEKPWGKYDKIRFLCPAPGYDRHFGICQHLGIEMITVPMLKTGPDMDMIEKIVASDDSVKGIWCVPKYSNPTGVTFSDETVRRFASLKPAAKDFKIFWDNAYLVHDLYDEGDRLLNIHEEAKKNGNGNMVFSFTSTSKITLAGGGVCFVASSEENIAWLTKSLALEGLGYDKVNQLRHFRYFKTADGVREVMKKHAAILRPKFETVLSEFDKGFGDTGIASYHAPRGGYVISLNVLPGTAKRTWALAKEAGVTLTNVGATFPYGNDPEDENLRIAPSNVKPEDAGRI